MVFVFVLLILSGCGSKGPEISNTDEFKLSGYRITPKSAKIEDGNLVLTIDWSFGIDEDSMDQEKFAATGIIFYATQNGEHLESDLSDTGIFKDVYEMNTSAIYPKFKLLNEKDPVEVTFNKELSSESEMFTVTLPN